jgi:hypothetical protein
LNGYCFKRRHLGAVADKTIYMQSPKIKTALLRHCEKTTVSKPKPRAPLPHPSLRARARQSRGIDNIDKIKQFGWTFSAIYRIFACNYLKSVLHAKQKDGLPRSRWSLAMTEK